MAPDLEMPKVCLGRRKLYIRRITISNVVPVGVVRYFHTAQGDASFSGKARRCKDICLQH